MFNFSKFHEPHYSPPPLHEGNKILIQNNIVTIQRQDLLDTGGVLYAATQQCYIQYDYNMPGNLQPYSVPLKLLRNKLRVNHQ